MSSKKIKHHIKKIKKPLKHVSVRLCSRRSKKFKYVIIAAVVLLMFTASIVVYSSMLNSSYSLSVTTQNLIGRPDKNSLKNFKYDAKTHSYYLNKSSIGTANSTTPKTINPNANSVKVGANYNNKPPFSLQLPSNSHVGITTYDNNSGLSFTLIPKFSTLKARQVLGHTVYPVGLDGSQAIYTVKANGLQEDVVFKKAPSSGTAKLQYQLKLPDTLQAKMMPGGNLGVYSADPALFGQITYTSQSDQLKVQEAKIKSPKNHLVFVIPAPKIITDDGTQSNNSKAHTTLKFSNNTITVAASGLNSIKSSFSIDPSVVVTAASDFQLNANNDGDITFDTTNGQITESGLSGATVPSWASTSALHTALYEATSVVYNGFIYEIGGNSSGTATAVVEWATINSNGTLGTWNFSSTTANGNLPAATYASSSVVYNGYVYEIGGNASSPTTNVYYASITSSGALSSNTCGTNVSWCLTTTLPVANSFASYVEYNGFIYNIGGVNATVVYASVNADGTLSSWTSSTTTANGNLPSSINIASAAVYNGYIYDIAGNNAGSNGVVLYAQISSSGALSGNTCGTNVSWCTTNGLPAADFDTSATIYNGVIYEIGGNSTKVQYAPINSDGTLGVWDTTTVLPNAFNLNATAVSYNGYLYFIGGNNGTTQTTTVSYAHIGNVGLLGNWNSGPTITDTYSTPTVAYNNHLYIVGKYTAATGGTGVSQWATIGADGSIGSWTSSTSGATGTLPYLAHYTASVAYNGFLYMVGGFSGSTILANVYYSPINSSTGALGTWTSTNNFGAVTAAVDKLTAVAYNGYIYEIGGNSGSTTNAVSYALICTGNNSGTGGCSSTLGSVGTWTVTGSLPGSGVLESSSFAYNGYIYEIGGDTGSASVNTVYYAAITSTGALNSNTNGCGATWCTNTNTIPVVTQETSSFASNGYVYLAGGANHSGTGTSVVDYAQINNDGSIGTWTATTSLPAADAYSAVTAYNGFIYSVGGTAGGDPSTNYVKINNGGTGQTSAWTASTSTSNGSLPTATYYAHSVASNGYLYEISGSNSGGISGVVYYAPLNDNGSVGTWTASTSSTTGSLPTALYLGSTAVYNNYIYYIGGFTGSSVVSTVYYAAVNSSTGALQSSTNGCGTSWCTTTSLPSGSYPTGGYAMSSTINNGYLYVISGKSSSIVTAVNYALICTGSNSGTGGCTSTPGTIGNWNTTSSLPTGLLDATAVTYGGYIYNLGGTTNVTNGLSTVNYALICTGNNSGTAGCSSTPGSLGTWNSTSSLVSPEYFGAASAYNGYIYYVGGTNSTAGGVGTAAVQYAPITSSGGLGNFTSTSSLSTNLFESGVAIYNGYIYSVGGYSSGTLATTSYAGLQSIPRIGNYSTLIDFTGLYGDDPMPIEMITNGGDCVSGTCTTNFENPGNIGNGGPGGIFIKYKFASNSCTNFNSNSVLPASTNLLGNPKSFIYTTDGCSTTTNLGRYAQINYILDDSETSTFPDNLSNHTSISSFTLYYHPDSASRLRGGATFSNGSQQSLDAAP